MCRHNVDVFLGKNDADFIRNVILRGRTQPEPRFRRHYGYGPGVRPAIRLAACGDVTDRMMAPQQERTPLMVYSQSDGYYTYYPAFVDYK